MSGEVDEDGEGNWDVVEVLEVKDCVEGGRVSAVNNGDRHCRGRHGRIRACVNSARSN